MTAVLYMVNRWCRVRLPLQA